MGRLEWEGGLRGGGAEVQGRSEAQGWLARLREPQLQAAPSCRDVGLVTRPSDLFSHGQRVMGKCDHGPIHLLPV